MTAAGERFICRSSGYPSKGERTIPGLTQAPMSRSQQSTRIMFVRNFFPEPGKSGGDEVVLQFLEGLSDAGCTVDFVSLGRSRSHNVGMEIAPVFKRIAMYRCPGYVQIGGKLFRSSPFAWGVFLEQSFRAKLPAPFARAFEKVRPASRLASFFGEFSTKQFFDAPSEADVRLVEERVKDFKPNVFIVDYAWLGPLFSRVNNLATVKKMVLGHEVIHLRAAAFKKAGLVPDLPDWDQKTELQHLDGADIVTVETNAELELMTRVLPNKIVLSFPRGLPFKQRGKTRINGRCLFVGSNASANVSGLRWFLNKAWPTVLNGSPSATLEVCGGVGRAFVDEKHQGVVFRGRVESLESHYEAAALCVMPLLAGSGFKTKLIEALTYGCACVSTSMGADGAEAAIGTAVIVQDNEKAFAQSIVRVLTDDILRLKMEAAAESFSKDHLSLSKTLGPVVDLLVNRAA
jgi:glycosyltransferase involved in cell wall biosynthesis